MIWNRTETIALAKIRCTFCHGTGVRKARGEDAGVCPCVLRAIFRACYERFVYCVTQEKYMSKVSITQSPKGRDRRRNYERIFEDYICDFQMVSRRSLTEEEYRIFRIHFLLGADWRLCCQHLRMERGEFFHHVYYIMQKLGRVFRELKPHALYPIDEYFAGRIDSGQFAHLADGDNVLEFPTLDEEIQPDDLEETGRRPLRPPLKKVA